MQNTTVAIVGAGGAGREVSWLLSDLGIENHYYVVESEYGEVSEVNGKPVHVLDEVGPGALAPCDYVVAIGDSAARSRLAEKMDRFGFTARAIVHPSAVMSDWVALGGGTLVCATSVVTTNVELGRHVYINVGCTVSHDVRIDDFVTLSPGVHVSGHVIIEEGAFLGTGAVVINGSAASLW